MPSVKYPPPMMFYTITPSAKGDETKLKETMKQLEREPLFAKLLADDAIGIELTALREQAAKLRAAPILTL